MKKHVCINSAGGNLASCDAGQTLTLLQRGPRDQVHFHFLVLCIQTNRLFLAPADSCTSLRNPLCRLYILIAAGLHHYRALTPRRTSPLLNMSEDYPRSRRDNRQAPPYPYSSNGMNDDYNNSEVRRNRPQEHTPPAPPIGDSLKPAMKREGSRTRLAPDTRPQFPDEASNAPDLERKNRARDRQFRDRRDGYESEEGEVHRKNMAPPRRHTDDDRPRGQDPRSRRPHDEDPPYPPPDGGRRRGGYDEERPRSSRNKRDNHYDDEDRPPRRRGDRPPPDFEYGSDPIPSRRGSERRPRRRQDDYSDEEEDYRPRRRRSAEDSRRALRRSEDEADYHSDGRRRRDDPYDDRALRRRDDRSRRRYDDDSDRDYDRSDRRDRDRRRGDKPTKPVMVGKYDVGPWIEKGQKHYATLAPIVTPLVINMARKYMTGQGGGSGGGGRR